MGDVQGLSYPSWCIVGRKGRETDWCDSGTKRAMLADLTSGGNPDHGPDIMRPWRTDVVGNFANLIRGGEVEGRGNNIHRHDLHFLPWG